MLASKILPELLANSSDDGRIRIWSAGCSTGEEPYSIAMSVLEQGAQFRGRDIKILATDIDTCVLDEAATGVYPLERIASLSEKRRRRWFHKGSGENAGKVKVISELKSLITFKPLNLMHTWPMPGRFDVIFCRNVLIYFDPETQTRLISRFGDYLNDKGYLFLGHSETMRDMYSRFDLLGKSGYRKVA